jgi:hypothetical protein
MQGMYLGPVGRGEAVLQYAGLRKRKEFFRPNVLNFKTSLKQ